jgi:hypothetical protein
MLRVVLAVTLTIATILLGGCVESARGWMQCFTLVLAWVATALICNFLLLFYDRSSPSERS